MPKKYILCFLMVLALQISQAHAFPACSFSEKIDFTQKKIDVILDFDNKSSLAAQLRVAEENRLELKAQASHIKTPFFDISTVVETSLDVVGDGDEPQKFLRGTIKSNYSIVDYKPADELSGVFEIREGRLYFRSLSWGAVSGNGYIGLVGPYEINAAAKLSDVRGVDLMTFLGCPADNPPITGFLSGQIKITGFIDRLILRGKLDASEGYIQEMPYESMSINFDGLYPVVSIGGSTITQDDGLKFDLSGNFDLRKKCSLDSGLASIKVSPAIDESRFDRQWTIKQSQSGSPNRMTNIKYRLKKNTDGISYKEDTDLLGIENSVKF